MAHRRGSDHDILALVLRDDNYRRGRGNRRQESQHVAPSRVDMRVDRNRHHPARQPRAQEHPHGQVRRRQPRQPLDRQDHGDAAEDPHHVIAEEVPEVRIVSAAAAVRFLHGEREAFAEGDGGDDEEDEDRVEVEEPPDRRVTGSYGDAGGEGEGCGAVHR